MAELHHIEEPNQAPTPSGPWGMAADALQGAIARTHLCELNDDGSLRNRNAIGAFGWKLLSTGTDCECCMGVRLLIALAGVPTAFVLGKYFG